MSIRLPATPAACPGCGHEIPWQHVRYGESFGCPSCRTTLRIRGAYVRIVNLAAWAIAFLLPYAIGLRNWVLLAAGFVAVIPISLIVTLITQRLFSVELEPTGEVRDILYPTDSHSADRAAAPAEVSEPRSLGFRVWERFKGINEPPTLEGYAIQGGLVAMAIFLIWIPAVVVLRSAFPQFDATRSGPVGFPVTVHIGESMLAITNGSDVRWRCRAELGRARLFGAFEVETGQTSQISFARFDPNGTLDSSRIRSAAQERISLVCDEPNGISHSATLQ
jgi:hypothetical protein